MGKIQLYKKNGLYFIKKKSLAYRISELGK